jgi:hypothetical protein
MSYHYIQLSIYSFHSLPLLNPYPYTLFYFLIFGFLPPRLWQYPLCLHPVSQPPLCRSVDLYFVDLHFVDLSTSTLSTSTFGFRDSICFFIIELTVNPPPDPISERRNAKYKNH